MSIVSTDLKFYLSGGADNTDPDASLGGVISTTEITDNTLNNLFDDITGDEHTAGDTEYRAFFFKNNSAETAYSVKIWISSNTAATDDTINIGIESALGSPIQTIADEATAPTGISFSTADSQSNSLYIGDMTTGTVCGVWVKRIVTAGSTPQASDAATFRVYVDSL
jgi:hypothetical protein